MEETGLRQEDLQDPDLYLQALQQLQLLRHLAHTKLPLLMQLLRSLAVILLWSLYIQPRPY